VATIAGAEDVMALSEEATRRFTDYLEHTDVSITSFGQDEALFDFAAWALVHEPAALEETFALDALTTEHFGGNDNKLRYVHAVLSVAQPLVAAYERARAQA
jgi:hypothetical protein